MQIPWKYHGNTCKYHGNKKTFLTAKINHTHIRLLINYRYFNNINIHHCQTIRTVDKKILSLQPEINGLKKIKYVDVNVKFQYTRSYWVMMNYLQNYMTLFPPYSRGDTISLKNSLKCVSKFKGNYINSPDKMGLKWKPEWNKN